MKKALVFGANGYLGRHIAYLLKQHNISFIPTGQAVTSVDNYTNYKKIDITKNSELDQLDFNVDYIFMFAGLTGTQNSPELKKKFAEVNEQGLINILEHCKKIPDVRIIFPSTRLVYKGVENTPLLESDQKEAKTIYAENKLNCEKILFDYNFKYKIDYTVFRICVPYGNLIDKTYSYGTIGFFISKASKGENITIYGDGSLKRTFTHVKDICEIILKSIHINSTKNKIYNIGSNDSLSLLDVADFVSNKYNVGVEFIDWPKEALKIESGDTIFNDTKLQKEVNYKYQYSLKEWVKELN
jgi:UDP-glucose 4-epimerase